MEMVMQGFHSAFSKYKDMETYRCYWTRFHNKVLEKRNQLQYVEINSSQQNTKWKNESAGYMRLNQHNRAAASATCWRCGTT